MTLVLRRSHIMGYYAVKVSCYYERSIIMIVSSVLVTCDVITNCGRQEVFLL